MKTLRYSPLLPAVLAKRVDPVYVGEQNLADVTVEKLEIPSPHCELRLHARDHHASKVCTGARTETSIGVYQRSHLRRRHHGLDNVKCGARRARRARAPASELIRLWEQRQGGQR
jgi:hypothetical protein